MEIKSRYGVKTRLDRRQEQGLIMNKNKVWSEIAKKVYEKREQGLMGDKIKKMRTRRTFINEGLIYIQEKQKVSSEKWDYYLGRKCWIWT